MKTEKKEYVDKMTHDLQEWSETIEEYVLMASRKQLIFQPEFDVSIRDLKAKRDRLAEKLKVLRNAQSDDGKKLEADVEAAKHELRDAFETAERVMEKAA